MYPKLVKEIRNRDGELHFKRWQWLSTPWFSVYTHYIAKSDEDKHPHSHPWQFLSIILWGSYIETVTEITCMDCQKNLEEMGKNGRDVWLPCPMKYSVFTRMLTGMAFRKAKYQYHKIKLHCPTYTLVITGRHSDDWGYLIEKDNESVQHIHHEEYRKLKNELRDADNRDSSGNGSSDNVQSREPMQAS